MGTPAIGMINKVVMPYHPYNFWYDHIYRYKRTQQGHATNKFQIIKEFAYHLLFNFMYMKYILYFSFKKLCKMQSGGKESIA